MIFSLSYFYAKTKPILVGMLYRPPDQSGFLEKLSTGITNTNDFDSHEAYILGDLNINLKFTGKRIPNGIKQYREFFALHGLKQLIDIPTRITSNSETILDHRLTTQMKIRCNRHRLIRPPNYILHQKNG